MRLRAVLILMLSAACSGDPPGPTAEDKRAELVQSTESITTGSEFVSLATDLGHECSRRACSRFCQEDALIVDSIPDEFIVCRWDEALSGYSDVVFGTAFSVIYVQADHIVGRDIEVVYTGP